MALRKTVTLAGGLSASAAYIMLNNMRLDKISGVVSGTIEIYLNEPTRRDREARYVELSRGQSVMKAASEALEGFKPVDGDGADEIRAKEQKSIPARAALLAAQGQVQAAQEMMKLQSLQAISVQEFNLQGEGAAACVREGALDIQAVYAQLKKLYFSGAEDC